MYLATLGLIAPSVAGAITANFTRPRTAEEQRDYENSTLASFLNFVPGVGIYNYLKSQEFRKAFEAKRKAEAAAKLKNKVIWRI